MSEMLELMISVRHYLQVCVCLSTYRTSVCMCEGTQMKGHTTGVTGRNTQHCFGTAVKGKVSGCVRLDVALCVI